MKLRRIFVAGIGTDVGKTIVSACLAEALKADYWKPIQCGLEPPTDSQRVFELLSNSSSRVHAESFALSLPCSPHAAAKAQGVSLELGKIALPATNNDYLVIEGVGGLLVPLNDEELAIDLIGHLDAEVVLVSRNYLGSINHTLLSIEALRARGLPLLGIIFSGEENQSSQQIILQHSGINSLGRIDWLTSICKETIAQQASRLKLEKLQ